MSVSYTFFHNSVAFFSSTKDSQDFEIALLNSKMFTNL